jgi:hypothetical protein
LLAEERLGFQEELVVVASIVLPASEAGKAIQVELSLEACQLGLPKISRHDMLHKFLGFVHDKSTSMWLPRHNMAQSISFDGLEHFVKLDRKGNGDASMTTGLVIFVTHLIFVLMDLCIKLSVSRMIVVVVFDKVTVMEFCRFARLLSLATTSSLLWSLVTDRLHGRLHRLGSLMHWCLNWYIDYLG